MLVCGSAERFRSCQGRFPQEYRLVFQGVLTQVDVKLGGADVGKVFNQRFLKALELVSNWCQITLVSVDTLLQINP
jgi:hypothetical protein